MTRQNGFAPILVVAIIALIAVVGAGAFFLGKSSSTNQPIPQTYNQENSMPQPNQMMGDNPLKYHDSYITFSSDGKSFKEGTLVKKGASVPDLIQLDKDLGKFKKGDLMIYFVDANTLTGPGTEQLGILSSSDLGKTWTDQGHMKLSGKSNEGAAVDPSLLQLEDGSLRVYYFGSDMTFGDPASSSGKHKVYSAKSSDGINFTVEDGVRFEDEKLTDPEVILFQGKYFMYYSVITSSKLATSTDGLNFTGVSIIGGDVGGVPGALALENGIRIFGCGRDLRTAFSTDGINFKLEGATAIKGCDPAAIKLSDGRYAMLYKIDEGMKNQQPGQQLRPPIEPH